MNKFILAGVAGLLLLGGSGGMQPAAAQGAPGGSYLGSCGDVAVRGDRLAATCRRRAGREQRSEISGFRRCVGDIGNDNGVLHCNFPGGPVWGQVVARPGPPAPAYAPPPAYGGSPRGGERAHFERCRELRHRIDELRDRRDQARDPGERSRLEFRLREMHERERDEECRH